MQKTRGAEFITRSTLVILGLFLAAALVSRASSSLIGYDVIHEETSRRRVLATVTGGWAKGQYRSDSNLFYADRVLRNYARACDAGYDVDVILVSYHGFENWTDYMHPLGEYYCHRIGRPISVHAEFFDWRPIPSHTHGIGGDLITRHREIFARERDSYDIFVSQEDDISIGPDQIDYFVEWSKKFEGTDFYPGFLNMEILDGVQYLDWRIKNADIFELDGELMATTNHIHTDGRSYMLTKKELALFSRNDAFWTGSINDTHGEFQPSFATPRWMHPFRKIVHPLVDFERSMTHHMSNKYIKLPVGGILFEPLTVSEQRDIFSRCMDGGDCMKCVEYMGAARLDVTKKSRHDDPVAKYACMPREDVKFSGFSPDKKKSFFAA